MLVLAETWRQLLHEYAAYADNHGGSVKLVATKPDFDLDIEPVEDDLKELEP